MLNQEMENKKEMVAGIDESTGQMQGSNMDPADPEEPNWIPGWLGLWMKYFWIWEAGLVPTPAFSARAKVRTRQIRLDPKSSGL